MVDDLVDDVVQKDLVDDVGLKGLVDDEMMIGPEDDGMNLLVNVLLMGLVNDLGDLADDVDDLISGVDDQKYEMNDLKDETSDLDEDVEDDLEDEMDDLDECEWDDLSDEMIETDLRTNADHLSSDHEEADGLVYEGPVVSDGPLDDRAAVNQVIVCYAVDDQDGAVTFGQKDDSVKMN